LDTYSVSASGCRLTSRIRPIRISRAPTCSKAWDCDSGAGAALAVELEVVLIG
jgi:hypothetical protein